MDHRPPPPAVSAEPAQWLIDRVDLWDHQHWPTGMVGAGFEAYARLFHPLDDRPGPLTWAAVARASGRILHASAQWDKISGRSSGAQNTLEGGSQTGVPINGDDPMMGELDTWALEALCDVLARHTVTPQSCYFAVWTGWGWWAPKESSSALHSMGRVGTLPSSVTSYYVPDGVIPEVLPLQPRPAPTKWQLDLSGPTFSLPGRDYYLFEGHINAAVRIGYWHNESWFTAQSPSFFWPADHSWCVATEIDHNSTIIGGSSALIDELRGSKSLEVLPIPPDAPYDDHLNN